MKRLLATALLALGFWSQADAGERAAAPTKEAGAAPVEVLVLGTWHFATPGQDLHNIQAEDVLTGRRQAELRAIADALAAFRPTRVMVEKTTGRDDLVDEAYAAFTPALLAEERNERVQIGYRVAHLAGLRDVHAIDEQPEGDEPDYFPFDALSTWAKENGQDARLESLMQEAAAAMQAFEREQARHDLATLLVTFNDPGAFQVRIDPYYRMLAFGDAQRQPGAELNAMWYLRNAKIFAKLMRVATPGDRVLVVYGAGHAYWLRHFAREVPGYRNVDPAPFLRAATRAAR